MVCNKRCGVWEWWKQQMWNKARPSQRKKKSSHSTIASHLCKQKFKKTRFKDVSRWLLLAKGTSPGSLPNPPGTVRPVARPGVQRRTVAAPPSTRAWGVSVGWVEWWIRMALNGWKWCQVYGRGQSLLHEDANQRSLQWQRGKFEIVDGNKNSGCNNNLGLEFLVQFSWICWKADSCNARSWRNSDNMYTSNYMWKMSSWRLNFWTVCSKTAHPNKALVALLENLAKVLTCT